MLCVGGAAAVAKEQEFASQTHDNQTAAKNRGAAIAGN
jgi:hypothetical protein